MCPLLIQVGDSERLRDESIVFVLEKFPTSVFQLEIYEGMVHVFQMLSSFIKVADVAMERLGAFARDCVAHEEEEEAIHTESGLEKIHVERGIRWISNDIKNNFPATRMTEEEVRVLLESSNGEVANDVASVLESVGTIEESTDRMNGADDSNNNTSQESDSAVSDVEIVLEDRRDIPFVPLPSLVDR
ncbi:UNVERIFIED_CONTAM: hypothetical protein HDU68_003805 [Siphonaria sp. JEL0065]|nr:hypothetical protein HDU68_003805 [Siphonaria sp. JEL0065]